MLGWLKKKVENSSADAMKNDVVRFTASLRGADDHELAHMVVISAIIRLNLLRMGKIPPAALDLSIPRDRELDIECNVASITLASAVKQFQKMDQLSDACGAMIWLHSIRALNVPEIRIHGREMWAELSRGHPYVADAVYDLQALMQKEMPEDIKYEARFVPNGLEPMH